MYKFDLRSITDILDAPKNVGRNQWVTTSGSGIESSDSYLYALRSRSFNKELMSYWESFLKIKGRVASKGSESYLGSSQGVRGIGLDFSLGGGRLGSPSSFRPEYGLGVEGVSSSFSLSNDRFFRSVLSGERLSKSRSRRSNEFLSFRLAVQAYRRLGLANLSELAAGLRKELSSSLVNFSKPRAELDESSRFVKRRVSTFVPILVSKAFLSLDTAERPGVEANVVNVFLDKERSVVEKPYNEQGGLVIKQKRYKRKKIILDRSLLGMGADKAKLASMRLADRPHFSARQLLEGTELDPNRLHRLLKKNRMRAESFSVSLSRRLLRTKKTIVLPAYVNIGLITNSYDVIHSWFIPGLGIKLDCVPGRSTHHVVYLDSVGFFYGQCAEICGRYHHHMPIRLCVLPFEHFLVW